MRYSHSHTSPHSSLQSLRRCAGHAVPVILLAHHIPRTLTHTPGIILSPAALPHTPLGPMVPRCAAAAALVQRAHVAITTGPAWKSWSRRAWISFLSSSPLLFVSMLAKSRLRGAVKAEAEARKESTKRRRSMVAEEENRFWKVGYVSRSPGSSRLGPRCRAPSRCLAALSSCFLPASASSTAQLQSQERTSMLGTSRSSDRVLST